MEISVAINSYKNPDLLRLCLGSIKKNLSGLEYEIIVADSETEEDTEMMMREDYPQVKFFPFKKNVGFQVMLNKGIEASSGKYILFLNSDILLTENSAQLMLDYIKQNPEVGIVAPQLLNFNGTFQPSCFRFYRPMTILYRRTVLKKFKFAQKHLDWFLMKDYDRKEPREVDWVMGSAMLVSRDAIKKVGLMDSRFFMYMEDVDWCRRFWENKYKVVYLPQAKMHHYHGKASAKGGFFYGILFNKLTWVHIISGIKYFFKYWGKPSPRRTLMEEEQDKAKQNRKLFNRIILTGFLALLLVSFFWIGFLQGKKHSGDSAEKNLPLVQTNFINKEQASASLDFSLFWKTTDILKEKYIDSDKLDSNKLLYGSIKGMLEATEDPYTSFLDPEENKKFDEEIRGSFEGIGAEMGLRGGILTIIAPLDGSPAEKAGLRPGDKIIKIDGESSAEMSLEAAVDKIRGTKGTEVKLTIWRNGDEETQEVTVKRDVVLVKSVRSEKREDGIGYIKISRFGDTTVKEFNEVLSKINLTNTKGLILDLRNNPGGYLDGSINIASRMLPKGKIVVLEEGSDGERKEMLAKGGDMLSQKFTAILINEGSASAAEILAGAIRENRENVVLVGKKTFGKGSVQELIDLPQNTAVKITVARWLTPTGKQINEVGINPDYEIELSDEDYEADRDPQMDKAVELVKEKI